LSDESQVYTFVGREFHTHGSVAHTRNEYARGVDHSNTVENFFSILKRGYIGHVSPHERSAFASLHRRIRLPQPSQGERCRLCRCALAGTEGKRLTYRGLTSATPKFHVGPRLFGERRKRWTR